MLILRLATRNLFRQKRRNVLSMVSITLGTFILVVGAGLARGVDENAIRGTIDSLCGHVMAIPVDYPATGFRHPVDGAFALDDEARAWLDESTTAWTPRLIAAPRAIKGRESMRVRLIGAAETDATVFPRDHWALTGTFPSDTSEILVAKGPARLLDVEIGDVMTLEARTVDGAMNAMRYTVSGTVSASNPVIDIATVFVTLPAADQLLNAAGRVTHVSSRVSHRDRNGEVAAAISSRIDGAQPLTWQEEVQDILDLGKTRAFMFNVLGFAMLGMAATGIANTVLMAAFERVGEIGTLRSMGMARRGVLAMFALEGLWMGALGGALGVAGAGAVNAYYAKNGIDMMAFMQGQEDALGDYPVSAMLYTDFSPTVLLVAWAIAVAISVLASIYPALAAARISPAEAVRPR